MTVLIDRTGGRGAPLPPNKSKSKSISASALPRRIESARAAERLALQLAEAGALFAVSHSGGKDSQAMLLTLLALGIDPSQIVLFYADLGDVMWDGATDHIRNTAGNLPLVVCTPASGFFDMVDRRGMFPTPAIRNCTSDLKRGPIRREIRRWVKARPDHSRIVVSCTGLRAEESADRASKPVMRFDAGASKAGRVWYEWLPIHALTESDVRAVVAGAEQDLHPVYGMGFGRFSCPFCFYASDRDHRRAAQILPRLYARYCQREVRHGHTLSPTRRSLPERTGIEPSKAGVEP